MKIRIQGFQSHKDTEFIIGGGVNAIVGQSGSGKSSILRAIDWVVNNKPSGDDFISHNANKCIVSLSDDNWEVTRVKGKGVNQYRLKIDGENEQVYEGFGKGVVPDIIKRILNIQDFNLRFQHQGPFLVQETSGEVNRYLNRIARLDIIDKAKGNIEFQIKRERTLKTIEEAAVLKVEDQLRCFDSLPEVDSELARIEKFESDIASDIKKYNALLGFWEDGTKLTFDLEKVKPVIRLKDRVVYWMQCNDRLNTVKSQRACLERLKDEGAGFTIEIIRQKAIVSLKARLITQMDLHKTINEIKARKKAISNIADDAARLTEMLVAAKKDLEKAKKEFHALMPDKCPLCGRGGK